jgi:hypothetical protein
MHSDILSGIIADLRVLIDQLDNNFKTLKELLLEVARRLDEEGQCQTNQISTKIKEILKDKIKEGKISEKWIEECLPQKYKRKYTKSELSSHSKTPKPEKIIIDTYGRTANELVENTSVVEKDHIERNRDSQSPHILAEKYYCPRCAELEEALRKASSVIPANEVQDRQEFCIPSDKHAKVLAAMQESDEVCYLIFDYDGILVDAVIRDANNRYKEANRNRRAYRWSYHCHQARFR